MPFIIWNKPFIFRVIRCIKSPSVFLYCYKLKGNTETCILQSIAFRFKVGFFTKNLIFSHFYIYGFMVTVIFVVMSHIHVLNACLLPTDFIRLIYIYLEFTFQTCLLLHGINNFFFF